MPLNIKITLYEDEKQEGAMFPFIPPESFFFFFYHGCNLMIKSISLSIKTNIKQELYYNNTYPFFSSSCLVLHQSSR